MVSLTIKKLSDWLPNVGVKWIVFDTIGKGLFAIERSMLVKATKAGRAAARRGSCDVSISPEAIHFRWTSTNRSGGLTLRNGGSVAGSSPSEEELIRVEEIKTVRKNGRVERKTVSRYLHPSEYERVVVPAP